VLRREGTPHYAAAHRPPDESGDEVCVPRCEKLGACSEAGHETMYRSQEVEPNTIGFPALSAALVLIEQAGKKNVYSTWCLKLLKAFKSNNEFSSKV